MEVYLSKTILLIKEKQQRWNQELRHKGWYRIFCEKYYDISNAWFYRRWGIRHANTPQNLAATIDRSAGKDSWQNDASSFYYIFKGFRHVPLAPVAINLLDLGCGSGRVLSVGMKLGFNQVTGVDLDEESLEFAEMNCRIMQAHGSRTRFSIHCHDAGDFAIPEGTNLIYLFNPFGERTLRQVVHNILHYLSKGGREVYLVYYFPYYRDVIESYREFKTWFRSNYKDGAPDLIVYKIEANTV
ncbi:class I SAM-dependent methyltransferase [Flavihumibacter rivuli]|uniref:class I SAM-dependent methyltransferase n=1 Tax=Flavihumibacter rivuli TaxID=2838156 RepID=UPI001BDF6B15|nr:class I SAM-dependent methyltransferase [Flavihumibacter rivuli]ULQ57005.1 class I SAM-dependent methyltransferase [Flavihumibacter rivuli]